MPRATLTVSMLVPALAAAFAAGCGREDAAPRPKTAASQPSTRVPADGVRTYKLTGVVRRVDAASGLVTISHEAIPEFMDAMTMPFTLKDHALLDDVRAGDEVEGSLRVERAEGEVKDYELTDLVVSRPAPAAPLKLDLTAVTSTLLNLFVVPALYLKFGKSKAERALAESRIQIGRAHV